MTTAAELLEAANANILKTLTSQEYQGPGGIRQRRADLKAATEFRQQLMEEIANSGNGNGSMCSLLSLEAAET
jgi:hypothetical protein